MKNNKNSMIRNIPYKNIQNVSLKRKKGCYQQQMEDDDDTKQDYTQ